MSKSKYSFKKTKTGRIPSKPKKWKQNGRLTPQARKYLSYKSSTRKGENKLQKKGMMSSGFTESEKPKPKTKQESKKVRVIYRWESHSSLAHSPIDVKAIIEGYEEDIMILRDMLIDAVVSEFGSWSENGRFYQEDIDRIIYTEPQLYRRRNQNEAYRKMY